MNMKGALATQIGGYACGVLTSAWEPAGTALGLHHYARAVADGSMMLACVGVGRMGPVPGFVTGAVASAAGAGNPR
jgi:hypothetical protein